MYSIFKARRSEQQWQDERGLVLFTWSIINPNGPTLSCVGIRRSGSTDQFEIFYRWFHFQGGESFILGFVSDSSPTLRADILEVLQYAFGQESNRAMQRFPMVTCVPSFITVPLTDGAQSLLSEASVKDLFSGCQAFRQADWGRELYYLNKYGSEFFDRGAEESRDALEKSAADPDLSEEGRKFLDMTRNARSHLPAFSSWKPNQYVSRGLEDGDVNAWWEAVTNNKFTVNCLMQFANAWVGAIYQVRHTLAEPAEPFDLVKDFLEFYNCSLWPELWTTAVLNEQMGFDR